MEPTQQDEQEYQQILDVFSQLAGKYTDNEVAPYHCPHAVAGFAHEYFHEVFERELITKAQEAMEEVQRRMEAGESVEGPLMAPINTEATMRGAFEIMLLVGFELGRAGYTLSECKCIDNIGDTIEQKLREGHSDGE